MCRKDEKERDLSVDKRRQSAKERMAERCRTIGDCLRQVGIDVGALERCATLDDEFKCIKKAYFKKILRSLHFASLLHASSKICSRTLSVSSDPHYRTAASIPTRVAMRSYSGRRKVPSRFCAIASMQRRLPLFWR